MKSLINFLTFASVVVGLSMNAQAVYTIPKFRINQYYDSNAVLQRGVTLPISGTADWGKTVSVTFNGQTLSTTATIEGPFKDNGEGRWTVNFPAMEAGGPYTLSVTDGTKTLTATNILVGDVWLVSGQSNAYYPIERFAAKDEWAKDADYPKIHFIMAGENHYEWILNPKPWQVASSETIGKCSATGFFFAKELQKSVDVPMGVCVAAWDGSWIKQWMPGGQHYESMLNNRLEPLMPFPVKGVIWYQGESDGMFARGFEHRYDLQKMIQDWRQRFNSPELPFLVAQLPHFGAYFLWYEIRDSQNWVAAHEKNVYVVPTLDIGDLKDIHPPRKPELGKRLSAFARKYVYGEKNVNPEGPVFRSVESKDGELIVRFKVNSPIKSSDGNPLNGFQVSGGEKDKFHKAVVRIVDGETLAVSSPEVKAPVAVRYGCVNEEHVNFFDSDGYSAAAFRSDSFKLPTEKMMEDKKHEHAWTLTASGAELTAVCSKDGCKGGKPKFAVGGESSKVYDGKPLKAVQEGTDFAARTGSSLGPIEYYQNGKKLSGAPVKAGVYEARIDVDHAGKIYTVTRKIEIKAAR